MDTGYFDLSVVIRPSMVERGAIEDDLEEILQERQLGEVWGAGAATNGSFCDLSIVVTDLEEGVRVVRDVLRRYGVPKSTVIRGPPYFL